jgi:hypothetical protein
MKWVRWGILCLSQPKTTADACKLTLCEPEGWHGSLYSDPKRRRMVRLNDVGKLMNDHIVHEGWWELDRGPVKVHAALPTE